MSVQALDMEAVALRCGYSWERFRKVWRKLPGFPGPIKRPVHGRGAYAWREESVTAWLEARERALGPGGVEIQPPANDHHAPRRAHASAVARERAQLARLMSGG